MGEKALCCPNCETVMVLRVEPDEVEGLWYECTICGHRIRADAVWIDAEGSRRWPHVR